MASNFYNPREWMYKHQNSETGEITKEFGEGLTEFMRFATRDGPGKIVCPCIRCNNRKRLDVNKVWNHLFRDGFTPNYFVWFFHGEDSYTMPSSSEYMVDISEQASMQRENLGTAQMVTDAYRENIPLFMEGENPVEEPNLEARKFFDMLDAAKHPIYEGCRAGHSPLSAATRMMNIKTDFNLSEDCVDAIADFVKEYMPEENLSPANYYEIHKLVDGLGLPFQMIDVCIENCMIYENVDATRLECRFCGKPRFQVTSGRVRVPYKRMWYLPLTSRLKRLYQSERTAGSMRWHAEHSTDGEIAHPSDAEAWKHFQTLYPDFARESRKSHLLHQCIKRTSRSTKRERS